MSGSMIFFQSLCQSFCGCAFALGEGRVALGGGGWLVVFNTTNKLKHPTRYQGNVSYNCKGDRQERGGGLIKSAV